MIQNKLQQCENTFFTVIKCNHTRFSESVSSATEFQRVWKYVHYFVFTLSLYVYIVCVHLKRQQLYLSAVVRRFGVYRGAEFTTHLLYPNSVHVS